MRYKSLLFYGLGVTLFTLDLCLKNIYKMEYLAVKKNLLLGPYAFMQNFLVGAGVFVLFELVDINVSSFEENKEKYSVKKATTFVIYFGTYILAIFHNPCIHSLIYYNIQCTFCAK